MQCVGPKVDARLGEKPQRVAAGQVEFRQRRHPRQRRQQRDGWVPAEIQLLHPSAHRARARVGGSE
jgi:hypothetical protein